MAKYNFEIIFKGGNINSDKPKGIVYWKDFNIDTGPPILDADKHLLVRIPNIPFLIDPGDDYKDIDLLNLFGVEYIHSQINFIKMHNTMPLIISDIIDLIMTGEADVIDDTKLIGPTLEEFSNISLFRYVDREYGEMKRKESIDNLKKFTLQWIIRCGYENSFSGQKGICIDGSMYSSNTGIEEYIACKLYSSETEANEFVTVLDTFTNELIDHALLNNFSHAEENQYVYDSISKFLNSEEKTTIITSAVHHLYLTKYRKIFNSTVKYGGGDFKIRVSQILVPNNSILSHD